MLDYSAEIEAAFDELTRILGVINEENENITKKVTSHTAKFEELAANPTPGSAGQRQKIGLLVASDMNLCASRFEDELPKFAKEVGTLEEGFAGLLKFASNTASKDRESVTSSRAQMAAFVEQAQGGIAAMRSYRDVVAGLRGVSKDVSRASRRLAQALDGVVENMEAVQAFAARAVALIDQWLQETAIESE